MCVFLLPCNPPPPQHTHMQQLRQGFHFLLEHNSFTKSFLNYFLQIHKLLFVALKCDFLFPRSFLFR